MYYSLVTGNLPDDLNPEGVATMLEAAADQVREMPEMRSNAPMTVKRLGVEVSHGMVFTVRDPEHGGRIG